MPFFPNASSCPKKLSSEYQPYACGNFPGHSSILEKIAILGQPPSVQQKIFIQLLSRANQEQTLWGWMLIYFVGVSGEIPYTQSHPDRLRPGKEALPGLCNV